MKLDNGSKMELVRIKWTIALREKEQVSYNGYGGDDRHKQLFLFFVHPNG